MIAPAFRVDYDHPGGKRIEKILARFHGVTLPMCRRAVGFAISQSRPTVAREIL
jgi:hypothetical protein